MSSSVTASPMPSREQHPKLWFLDGDLVLCAPVTSGQQRVYRIHRFIVTQNSPVLGEHLEAVEKKIDVELIVQDNAELIDILLSFWYNPLYLPFKHFDSKNTLLFHRLLCLCTNYKITSLRTRIIQFLEEEWPLNLASWDQRERHLNALALQPLRVDAEDVHTGPFLDDLVPEPASIVRLSRTHNIPSILPAAFFELSRTDRNADYTNLHAQPHRQSIQSLRMLSAGVRSAMWSALSNEDHMCIHRGHDAMQRTLLQFFEKAMGRCLLPVCLHGRNQVRMYIWMEAIKRRDVLGALQSVRDGRFMVANGVCAHCTLHMIETIRKIREVIFHSLGRLFGITG